MSIRQNEEKQPKLLSIVSSSKSIENLLHSKFGSIFFSLMSAQLKSRMKEKMYNKLPGNKNSPQNAWDHIYKMILYEKKGLVPKFAYKYIKMKARATLRILFAESIKFNKKYEEYVTLFLYEMQKTRDKLIKKKREEGIVIDDSEYYSLPRRRPTKDLTYSSKWNTLQFNNIKDRKNSDEEDVHIDYKAIKTEIEKVKHCIDVNLKMTEKLANKKNYGHIKSRFLVIDHDKLSPKYVSNNVSSKQCLTQPSIDFQKFQNSQDTLKLKLKTTTSCREIPNNNISNTFLVNHPSPPAKKNRVLNPRTKIVYNGKSTLSDIGGDLTQTPTSKKSSLLQLHQQNSPVRVLPPINSAKHQHCISYFNKADFYYK